MRFSVSLIRHRPDNNIRRIKFFTNSGNGSSLHLTCNRVKIMLQVFDVFFRSNKLVPRRNRPFKDMFFTQNLNRSIISKINQFLVTVKITFIADGFPGVTISISFSFPI